jgi:hypothetical protein
MQQAMVIQRNHPTKIFLDKQFDAEFKLELKISTAIMHLVMTITCRKILELTNSKLEAFIST